MSNSVSLEYLNSVLPSGGNTGFTAEGGLYETFVNDTGVLSVKGTVVIASPSVDSAVAIAPANAENAIGVVYDNGITNGQPMKVVTYGRAQVLLKNSQASNRGYWCGVSDTAGRMYKNSSVPSTTEHNREIGHSLETKASGTNVLAFIQIHFN